MTARNNGRATPLDSAQIQIIYHYRSEMLCAHEIAAKVQNAMYLRYGPEFPQVLVQPLSPRLPQVHGAIELWIPGWTKFLQ